MPGTISVFKTLFTYFRERGREGEREKHQHVVASSAPPTGDPARNPGMCPDWELNWRPFGSQASTRSTEPHQPGLFSSYCVLGTILSIVHILIHCNIVWISKRLETTQVLLVQELVK